MRSDRGRLAAVLLAAVLGSCAASTTPNANPLVAVSQPSPRFVGLVGRRFQHSPPFLGVSDTNYFCLRSFVDRRNGDAVHQLYVADSYSGAKRDWNAAHDPAGNALKFVRISRNEISCDGGCSYAEEFAADLPEDELRASPEGLQVTFTARSGAKKTIYIPGAQITAQLAAVDAERRMRPSTAAAPHTP
jgi:hypothetical protein